MPVTHGDHCILQTSFVNSNIPAGQNFLHETAILHLYVRRSRRRVSLDALTFHELL